MDSHVEGGGEREGCKWAKSSQTLGTLWYFKPIHHECLYELKTNLLMPRQGKYKSKLVLTLLSELKQIQTIHTVRLRGFLFYCNTDIHTICLIAPLEQNATQRNTVYHVCIGIWHCPSIGAFCVTLASVSFE